MKDTLSWIDSLQRLRLQLQSMERIHHLKNQGLTGQQIGERMGAHRRSINRQHMTYRQIKEEKERIKKDINIIVDLLDGE